MKEVVTERKQAFAVVIQVIVARGGARERAEVDGDALDETATRKRPGRKNMNASLYKITPGKREGGKDVERVWCLIEMATSGQSDRVAVAVEAPINPTITMPVGNAVPHTLATRGLSPTSTPHTSVLGLA